MDIREKMQLMYSTPVNAWHEHVWFNSDTDTTLNIPMLDSYMEVADRMGFDKVVMSLPIITPKRCSVELFKAANTAVYEAMKRYPDKIYGMAYVHAGHIREALDEIDHCIQDLGMIGLKLYFDYFMDDPIQAPIIEKCIDLDIPMMMHSMRSMDPGNHRSQPLCTNGVHMANAAKRYPEAIFQMGHFTITDWEFQLKAIAPYQNIYTDMSGSAYDCPQIERAVQMLGADRILFATDNSIVSCVGKILGADISVEDKKTILEGKAFNRFLEKAGR